MVRRSRHHGVVGQSLAQRGLCDLDGDEGCGAVLSAMAKLAERLRPEAVRHGARRPAPGRGGATIFSPNPACNGDAQRLSIAQDRFVTAPGRAAALPPRTWQMPVAVGPVGMAQSADVVLLQGSTEVPAGSCGEAI